MIWSLKKWQRHDILQREPIAEAIWQDVLARVHFLRRLTQSEITQLRQWATIFLHDKNINGAQGLIVTEEMRVMIAIAGLHSDSEAGFGLLPRLAGDYCLSRKIRS